MDSKCNGCGFYQSDCVCDLVADLYEKESLFRKVCEEMMNLNIRRDEVIREKVAIVEAIGRKRGYNKPAISDLIG